MQGGTGLLSFDRTGSSYYYSRPLMDIRGTLTNDPEPLPVNVWSWLWLAVESDTVTLLMRPPAFDLHRRYPIQTAVKRSRTLAGTTQSLRHTLMDKRGEGVRIVTVFGG